MLCKDVQYNITYSDLKQPELLSLHQEKQEIAHARLKWKLINNILELLIWKGAMPSNLIIKFQFFMDKFNVILHNFS